MNEQELAQLLSEQLDQMFEGEAIDFTAVMDELQMPLQLGQQLSAVDFPPSPVAEAAFESQLANWFGPSAGPAFPVTGLSKTGLFYTIVALVGVGLGVLFLLSSLLWSGSGEEVTPAVTLPATKQETTSESPAFGPPINEETVTVVPTASSNQVEATATKIINALEDTIPLKPNASQGDALPSATPTTTIVDSSPEVVSDPNNPSSGDESEQGSSAGEGDSNTSTTDSDPIGDHDRGHGNDADGFDEDNPGNSSGVSDNGGGNLSPGNFSQGNSGGSSGNGGQSNGSNGQGSDNGNGGGNGGGNGKGNGKGKGKGK
ncbi:MAG: hypothetical protein KDJ52_22215 [Anaerolineae bacterium]|nr:hypothetical protein [Anaerolineae bacterium]